MKVVILLPQQWCVLLLFLLPAAAASPPPPLFNISIPGCPDKCGNERVPYPFGFGRHECFKSSSFELNCTYDDKDQNYKLSQGGFNIENISMQNGTATIYVPMHRSCYNSFRPGETFYYSGPGNTSYYSRSGNTSYYSRYASWLGTEKSAFTVSSKQNKFTALGCSTTGTLTDSYRKSVMTGCFSACYPKVNLTEEDGGGGCTGRGCCRTQIPRGSKLLYMSLITTLNNVSRNFSPCSYAFVSNQDWIGFTNISLRDTSNVSHTSPVVVDWVVGNETCESSKNSSTHACRDNTNCNNSYNGPGYFCSCKQGYQGNPYFGCQDIDECKDKKHNCEGTCKNKEGSFTCHCPLGTHVDDKGACKGFRLTTLAVVIGVCLSLVIVIFFLWMECKRRNKARNFLKNGGNLLDNHEIIIYKEKDLKKATKNYHQDQLLGKGGSGFVYKGKLLNKEVAIKKPKVDPDIGRGGIRQYFRSREKLDHNFQNEIKMICKVYHKNIVKLVGLCLETKVPILVYEFIPNDSLYHHIHSPQSSRLNSWKNRLRIAYDTAVALDYLHSKAGDTSIIHGDVKSKNILLDKNFTPKVADFGASVTVTLKQNSFSITKVQGTHGNLDHEFFLTKLQGTRGYMDPEYRSTGVLTVKSDVYSFGVVLMELLTSKKPISGERPIDQVEFVPYFIFSVEDDKLGKVIDCKLEDEDQKMKLQVEAVAKLAVKCLNRSSHGRPDMAKVVKKLGKLNAKNFGVRVDQSNNIIEEKESIVSVDCSDNISMPSCCSYTETQYMTAFDEIQLNPSS